jgi:FAD/FMN-containing dehydrogenase
MTTSLADTITTLRKAVTGSVVTPDDAGYEQVRAIWNAMVTRRPAAIVRCAGADDVPRAIAAARAAGLEIAVRGAGHNIAGNALTDGGLCIDFSTMREVRVDLAGRRATAQPGATLADFDAAAQAHGLATPLGINSTTGIAGLTLGGGFGWLTRKHGMTVDNLLAADVVLADGTTRRASATENADLFWAIRGGGGNFGVVTGFEYTLHPLGPEIFAGLVVYPFAQAKQVLEGYRAFAATAPEDLTAWVVLRKAPPLPFLPPEVHGKEVVILAAFWAGEPARGEAAIAPLRGFGSPVGAHAGPQPYVAWQQAFDPLLAPGARNYWKSHNFTELADGALDAMIEYAGALPSPQCEIFIAQVEGAANRVAPDAMAYGHRDARYVLNVHGRWDEPAQDATCIAWARRFFEASAPYATGTAYTNFMTADEGDRVATAYGPNYARLAQLKRRFDPDNVFHLNQNVAPAP